jgi:DNA excision repair protein ERCC-2
MCMTQRTHLLAHAPTGLGKTAVALTAAVETALASDGLVLFLTSRQAQHAIAIETLRGIWKKNRLGVVDLIAREDMCLALRDGRRAPCTEGRQCFFSRDPEGSQSLLLDYPLHTQEGMRLCLRAGLCPHRAALRAAADATVIVGDYNQLFGRGPNLLQRLGRKEGEAIIIVDEAHNLPNRVMDGGSGSLTAAALQKARASPLLKHFAEDLDIIAGVISRLDRSRPERVVAEDLDGPLKQACGVDAGGLAEEIEVASKGADMGGLVDFLYAWSAPNEVTVRYLDGDPSRLAVSLIDPSPVTAPVLARVRCALLMSGTLHPPEMFAEVLGAEGALCRRYPSPFAAENRLVLASGGVSSRFRLRTPAMYAAVAREVVRCTAHVPGNVAVFFPSYDFLGKVEKLLEPIGRERRLVVERREHGKNERDAVLCQLREGRNLLLGAIGGSLSEGVDYRDNLLSMVIVVGWPLAPPSREMEGMLDRMEKRFGQKKANLYVQVYPAVSKVLQAAGRAIRSERDRAAVMLLDDRYLLSAVRGSFPEDFDIERDGEIEQRLAEFFSRPAESEGGGPKGTA